ncbi:MAG: GNAT family N-acetyltransferase [Christensenellales bacterium]
MNNSRLTYGEFMKLVEYTPAEYDNHFERLHGYFKEDCAGLDEESLEYFLSDEYRREIESLMNPAESKTLVRAVKLVDGADLLGFALYVNYAFENRESDGELFILEFCIEPTFRGCGYGKMFYEMIEAVENMRGAKYAQLTADRAVGFWQKVGFKDTVWLPQAIILSPILSIASLIISCLPS